MANGFKDTLNRFWNGSNDKTFTNAFNKALGNRTNGAKADEVIQCRCRVKYEAKRNGSGRLQFNDEAEIQEALRQRLRNNR